MWFIAHGMTAEQHHDLMYSCYIKLNCSCFVATTLAVRMLDAGQFLLLSCLLLFFVFVLFDYRPCVKTVA